MMSLKGESFAVILDVKVMPVNLKIATQGLSVLHEFCGRIAVSANSRLAFAINVRFFPTDTIAGIAEKSFVVNANGGHNACRGLQSVNCIEPPAQAAEEAPAPKEAEKDAPLGLTPDELALLEDLLSGRAPKAASPDLLVDSINEKLFDLVGDTVLEFSDAGAPQLIEDYVEDVREALS